MDNTSKIACCNICLLADAMKDCINCPFNPGKLTLKPAERLQVARVYLLKDSTVLTMGARAALKPV